MSRQSLSRREHVAAIVAEEYVFWVAITPRAFSIAMLERKMFAPNRLAIRRRRCGIIRRVLVQRAPQLSLQFRWIVQRGAGFVGAEREHERDVGFGRDVHCGLWSPEFVLVPILPAIARRLCRAPPRARGRCAPLRPFRDESEAR